MIAALRGIVLEKDGQDVIVDVNGVGYRVTTSLLNLARLPEEGQPVRLRIHTIVREDALELYGFLSHVEERLFNMLMTVSGVGPKAAMNVLSGLEVETLAACISRGEVGRLTKIRGVGKKTAERLVLELKDKVKLLALTPGDALPPASMSSKLRDDLVSALVNLGYKGPQADKAADVAAEKAGPEASFETLFREALKSLRQG